MSVNLYAWLVLVQGIRVCLPMVSIYILCFGISFSLSG